MMEREKLNVFISFASFVLAIVENVSRLLVLRASTNVPRSNKPPFELPKQSQ